MIIIEKKRGLGMGYMSTARLRQEDTVFRNLCA